MTGPASGSAAVGRTGRPALKVVGTPAPAPSVRAPDPKAQLALTRALARAMAREQKIEDQLREARAQTAAAFVSWAAGRSVNRDQARETLTAAGFLPRRKPWED